MGKNDVVAFILAGGKGTRLESLTKKNAKPAVFFGGKYRIIDFVLSNCANSGLDKVGIAIQYESIELSNYVSSGRYWGFDGINSELSILSPRQKAEGGAWYVGTADAVYQNLDYLDNLNPENVLILSADHIYKLNYSKMIKAHIKNDADLTICTIKVKEEDRSRFGMVDYNSDRRIIGFEEKPKKTDYEDASMGVYVFKYKVLRDYLIKDSKREDSHHDFGKDIIPLMLKRNKKIYSYPFVGYWRDVGTVESLWRANMDLIHDPYGEGLLYGDNFKVLSEDTRSLPEYIGPNARVTSSLINQGSFVFGRVNNSVVFSNAIIDEGAIVDGCVLMPGCHIKNGAKIYNSIIASGVIIEEGRQINVEKNGVLLISK